VAAFFNAGPTLNISYVTISRYMQGRVANIATGIALLNLFRQRLQKRQQKLKQAIKSWDEVKA
jgi:hypothetical protein